MRNLFIISFVLLFSSCVSNIDSDFVEKNGEKIKSTFASIVISKRNNIFLIEDKRFKPSRFIEVSKKKNSYVIESNLEEKDRAHYLSIIETLEHLNFVAATTEDSLFGINIKLYGEDENLIYCSNVRAVKEKEWAKYIHSLRKINDNWYVEENKW